MTFFVVHFNNAIPLENVVQTSGPGAMCNQQCNASQNVSTAMGEFTKPFFFGLCSLDLGLYKQDVGLRG